MNALLDRILDFSERHKKALAIVAGIWFWVGVASYARFIGLPEIPFLTDRAAIFVSGAFNALWWGLAWPAMERRKKARTDLTIAGAQNG